MTSNREPLKNYTLNISDSELLAYLYACPEPQRDRFILAALRIGFTALAEAKVDLDRKAIIDMTEQLSISFTEQRNQLMYDLKNYSNEHGPLQNLMDKQVESLKNLFVINNPNGITEGLKSYIIGSINELEKSWSLDIEGSAFSKIQALLTDHKIAINNTYHQLVNEIKLSQSKSQIRHEESLKGTQHGIDFENKLNSKLIEIIIPMGHIFESTGSDTGIIDNCKVGDAVVTIGKDHVAAGANIVIEAKQAKNYSHKKILKELTIARKNRQAEIGIFVYSIERAPQNWPAFQRFEDDIIVVWDSEDNLTDIHLSAALSVAFALCTKREYHATELPDFIPMQQAVIDLEHEISHLEEIHKLSKTMKNNAEKIVSRTEKMSETTKKKIADLNRCISQLQRLDFALVE